MGVGYILINNTKKEAINYYHLPSSKMKELAGNPITSAITTWYLLNNRDDDIRFIPDTIIDRDLNSYNDVTSNIIKDLIKEKIIKDDGFEFIDKDDPEIYIKKYINIWMSKN